MTSDTRERATVPVWDMADRIRKTTWSGLVASVVAIALGVWGITIVFNAVDELDRDLERIEEGL